RIEYADALHITLSIIVPELLTRKPAARFAHGRPESQIALQVAERLRIVECPLCKLSHGNVPLFTASISCREGILCPHSLHSSANAMVDTILLLYVAANNHSMRSSLYLRSPPGRRRVPPGWRSAQ